MLQSITAPLYCLPISHQRHHRSPPTLSARFGFVDFSKVQAEGSSFDIAQAAYGTYRMLFPRSITNTAGAPKKCITAQSDEGPSG